MDAPYNPVPMLRRVDSLNTNGSRALTADPPKTRIKALIESGLLKASRQLCGPLRIPTGELALEVTDAGRKLLVEPEPAQETA